MTLTEADQAALRAETTARVAGQIAAAGRRHATQRAARAAKATRRTHGVDARNRHKEARLRAAERINQP